MTKNKKTACIFGGTGFIGRQIVRELAKLGYVIKVASRVPERAYFLRPCGAVGQIVPLACDYKEESIEQAVKGCDVVVNCIGILYERGKRSTFQKAHVETPAMIARACTKQSVERFVHISALACDIGTSKYAKSKKQGEEELFAACPTATVLRPSIVFGPDDGFFNLFAELSRYLPALPLIGGGHTKFQPVYVGDVSDAVIACVKQYKTAGQIYELGGPDIVTFRECLELIAEYTERRRAFIPLPFPLAKAEAAFLQLLPNPLLTIDQVESLKTDNILSGAHPILEDLGIQPTALSLILPTYLKHYRPGGARAVRKDGPLDGEVEPTAAA